MHTHSLNKNGQNIYLNEVFYSLATGAALPYLLINKISLSITNLFKKIHIYLI